MLKIVELLFILWVIGYIYSLISTTKKSSRPKALGNERLNIPKKLYNPNTESLFWIPFNLLLPLLSPAPKPTTHGSAEFMGQKELEKLLSNRHDGLVMDGKHRLKIEECLNTAVIGGTGSGKTSKFIIPNLLRPNNYSSIFITDPSGECLKKCGNDMFLSGFKILVLNLEKAPSLCFNPLSRAKTKKDIQKISDIIVHSAFPSSNGNDQFWVDGAASAISLVIKALQKHPKYYNLANVRHVLQAYNPKDTSILDHFMAQNLTDPNDFNEYKGLITNDPKVLSSFMSTAKVSLKILGDDHLARLTSIDTIGDFKEMRTFKIAFFLQFPENQTSYYQFIIKILYTQFFDMCMETGLEGNFCRHIMVYLEEFANIGAIPNFSKLITTLRKRNVCVNIILQALEQVDKVYPRQSEEILYGGINTKLYLNSLSQKTCEMLSRTLGNHTIEDEDKGYRHARSLLTPDEIRLMDKSHALMLHHNQKPVKMEITPYYKDENLEKSSRRPIQPSQYSHSELPPLEFIDLNIPSIAKKRDKDTSQLENIKFDI